MCLLEWNCHLVNNMFCECLWQSWFKPKLTLSWLLQITLECPNLVWYFFSLLNWVNVFWEASCIYILKDFLQNVKLTFSKAIITADYMVFLLGLWSRKKNKVVYIVASADVDIQALAFGWFKFSSLECENTSLDFSLSPNHIEIYTCIRN